MSVADAWKPPGSFPLGHMEVEDGARNPLSYAQAVSRV